MSLKGKAASFGSDLATALVSATSGDTLEIGGTCVGNFQVFKNLTLVGKSSGKAPATLDGGQAGTTLYVAPATTVTVTGLLITNGNAGAGGGIYASVGSNLTLNNSVVSGNIAGGGGGIVTTGTLSLISSSVQNNTANAFGGGGIYDGGTVSIDATSGVTGNHSLGAGGYGGGILNLGSVSIAFGGLVNNNNADVDGGGIYSFAGSLVGGSLLGVSGNTPTNCSGTFSC
jgi:hypothetical protein